jgi:hypothetical protein
VWRKRKGRVWCTAPTNGDGHPCIWGAKRAAYEGRDDDEVVVQIEYRVLTVVKPRSPGDPSAF